MWKKRRLKHIKNNVYDYEEVGFAIANILWNGVEEYVETNDIQRLIFTGKDFDTWSNKIRNFLNSEGLWNFVENRFEDSLDEAKDALALYLIQQSLDVSILFKIAATNTSKEAWEILKEEFDLRGSSTNINQNDEAIVNIAEGEVNMKIEDNEINISVSEREHGHMVNINEVQYASVDDTWNGKSNIEITEDEDFDLITTEAEDENNFVVEAMDETVEVIYDEDNLSDEEWFKIMQKKKLIDNLLNGRHLLEIVNDGEYVIAMETKTIVLDNVVDSLHAEAEDDICEANDAIAIEQYEKKNVTNDILRNVSKCGDLEKPGTNTFF